MVGVICFDVVFCGMFVFVCMVVVSLVWSVLLMFVIFVF